MHYNKKVRITNKISINSKLRSVSISFLCILLILMLAIIVFISIKGKYVNQKIADYSYLNNAKVNYQVFLMPNNLYPPGQKSIGEGNVYIKKLIDHIETNLKYEFSGNMPAELQGKYSVRAVLDGKVGDEKSKKTIWKQEEQLVGEQTFKANSNKNIIEVKANIDPKHFEDIAKSKSQESGLNFETNLVVYWDIQIEAKTDKGIAHEQLNPTMEIPIDSNTYFEIKGNLTPQKKGAIEKSVKVVSPTYKIKFIVCVSVVVISLLILLFLLLGTSNKPSENPLQVKLKKIFKNHGDRLVRLVNENLIGMVQLIHLKDFDDLVRIADDIGKPIFYKDNEDSNEISTFYIFDEGYVYIFDLKKTAQEEVVLDEEYETPPNSRMFIRY